MSKPLENYRLMHPDLPIEILTFFATENRHPVAPHWRTVMEFVEHYAATHGGVRTQPDIVDRICERLVDFGWMTQCQSGTLAGHGNRYVSVVHDQEMLRQASTLRTITCAIYGFLAVYDFYHGSVLPIVHQNSNGELQIGTAFVVSAFELATARHCIEEASRLSVREIKALDWQGAKIYVHAHTEVDIALIRFATPVLAGFASPALVDGTILQEVLALGYPDVPGYHPTVTAEKATIASRQTASRGSIASTPSEIWTGVNVFLVTARVRGGFSGGPLLDPYGDCVGLIARQPDSLDQIAGSHRYDDLGYGIGMPASLIKSLIEDQGIEFDCYLTEFVDYE